MKLQRVACKRDKIQGNSIILDGGGYFPKDVIIIDKSIIKKYRLVKTKTGKFQLNKTFFIIH